MSSENGDGDVLKSLPRTRPSRRSAKRDAKPAEQSPAADASSAPPRPSTKRKPAAKTAAAKKPKAAAAKPKRAAAKPEPVATKPAPPPSGYAAPKPEPSEGRLVGDAVQAAAELAGIGLTLGRQAIGQALSRLPRP